MMKKIGIFFGSSTGMTGEVAEDIAKCMNVSQSDVHDVAQSKPDEVEPYDVLILGSSTWGEGDLQDDWYDFIAGLEALDLKGKDIAIFGCGDESMSDSFCGAVGEIYKRLQTTGARFIGAFDASVYSFDKSPAYIDGEYVGLLLDNVNHDDLTPDRVKAWTDQLKKEIEK